jgi:hypothetical protein
VVGVGLIEQVGGCVGYCVSAKQDTYLAVLQCAAHTLCYTLINTEIRQYTHVTQNVTLVYFTVLYTIGVVVFVPFS